MDEMGFTFGAGSLHRRCTAGSVVISKKGSAMTIRSVLAFVLAMYLLCKDSSGMMI